MESWIQYSLAIPLNSKVDFSESLTQTLDLEMRHFGYYPTVFHSDFGTEFINNYLWEFCNKKCIQTRYSDAYTPQQNGLAEQFNCSIIESMCFILKYSNLSLNYWNEVFKASIVTLNQIPSDKFKKSLFKLLKIAIYHPIISNLLVLESAICIFQKTLTQNFLKLVAFGL